MGRGLTLTVALILQNLSAVSAVKLQEFHFLQKRNTLLFFINKHRCDQHFSDSDVSRSYVVNWALFIFQMTITMMFCNNVVSFVYLGHLGDICDVLLHSIHFISQNIWICINGKENIYINYNRGQKSLDTWCNELCAFYQWSLKKIRAILLQTIPLFYPI